MSGEEVTLELHQERRILRDQGWRDCSRKVGKDKASREGHGGSSECGRRSRDPFGCGQLGGMWLPSGEDLFL